MKKRKFQLYIFVIVIVLIGTNYTTLAVDVPPTPEMVPEKKWTVLLYDDADFYHAYDPLSTIVGTTGSTENINVLVLVDKEHGPASIYYIDEAYNNVLLEELGEINMGAYATLRDFIMYGKTHYPADRYLVTLYNHGGGWHGACWDETNESDNLEMDEMQRALNESGGVDIISFSACTMGCIESVYELRNEVDVYIGSEEMHGFGSYWLEIPSVLDENPEDTTIDVSKKIMDIYKEHYPYFGVVSDWTSSILTQLMMGIFPYPPALTISAVHTDAIEPVATAMDTMANILIEHIDLYKEIITNARLRVDDFPRPMSLSSPFGDAVDIVHFMDLIDTPTVADQTPELHTAIEDVKHTLATVIIDEHHQIGHRNAHGLSIYFPPVYTNFIYKKYDPTYANCGLDFTEDTVWDDFLQLFLENDEMDDENDSHVDQSQTNMESGAVLCDEFTWAQSFIPSADILTMVKIPVFKKGMMFTDLILSIRKNLTGDDVTRVSTSFRDIPRFSQQWILFDFDDIPVEPGSTYYIVCKTRSGNNKWNFYIWSSSATDIYQQGDAWISFDHEKSWKIWESTNSPRFDFAFKTYGNETVD